MRAQFHQLSVHQPDLAGAGGLDQVAVMGGNQNRGAQAVQLSE